MPNSCHVKYISIETRELHSLETMDINTFVIQCIEIEHSSYEDLHNKVFSRCPKGYTCMEPMTLYHEVICYTGLYAGLSDRLYNKIVKDQLHHAIEEGEYASPKIHSICVHITKHLVDV